MGQARHHVGSGSRDCRVRHRQVILVLPGAVPVAELVPQAARSVGLLDGATAYGGYLLSQDGRELGPDAGLVARGCRGRGLLCVTAGINDPTRGSTT